MARSLYLLSALDSEASLVAPAAVIGVDADNAFISWLPGAEPGPLAEFADAIMSADTPTEVVSELLARSNGFAWDITELPSTSSGESLSDAVFSATDELLATPGV